MVVQPDCVLEGSSSPALQEAVFSRFEVNLLNNCIVAPLDTEVVSKGAAVCMWMVPVL